MGLRAFHSRTQHPVGQGGMHSAVIELGDSRLRYVYDCGSNNADRLVEEIALLAGEADRIDLLFLSHLDQDHVTGVDRLLAQVTVDLVVLPYLSAFDRALLVVEAAARPTGTTSATSAAAFLENPTRWLKTRGAERVVYVRSAPDDTVLPPAPDVPARDQRQDTLLRAVWRGAEPEEVAHVGATLADEPLVMPSGPIALGRTRVVWELVPYVFPEPDREASFVAAVARALGFRSAPPLDDPAWIARVKRKLQRPADRDVLGTLYKTYIRKNRNLSSMSLLSAPYLGRDDRVTGFSGGWRFHMESSSRAVGWIGTGDMHLDVEKRRVDLERFHRHRLPSVSTFVLPHHGARRNLPPSFVMDHGDLIWVAAYGIGNSYRHPDPHLMRVADAYGSAVRVNQRLRTRYVESCRIEFA